MDRSEIEELFKSKKIVKDKALTDALIRNYAILQHDKASDLDRKIAEENIKKISAYSSNDPKMKPINPKSVQAPVVGSKPQAPAESQQAAVQLQQDKPVREKRPKLEYHPDFEHFSLSPESYAAMPYGHKQSTHEFHKEVLAGKHPEEHAKIKAAAAAALPQTNAPAITATKPDLKIVKSLDRLATLFKNLKDQL